jgi:hypothetical protein
MCRCMHIQQVHGEANKKGRPVFGRPFLDYGLCEGLPYHFERANGHTLGRAKVQKVCTGG